MMKIPPGPPGWHQVKAITVDNRAPDAADMRQLLHDAGGSHAKAHRVVHHVFIHLPAQPPAQSTGHELWIGNHRVAQYHEFQDGITFRVHDAAQLASFYGQPIRFVPDHGPELPTGVKFPDLSGHLSRTVGERWHRVYRP